MNIFRRMKKNLNSRPNPKGQAFLELLLVIPIFVLFLVGISFFAKIYLTKIFLAKASHYGIFLIVHKNHDKEQVKNEIFNYLKNEKNLLPEITIKDLVINVDLGLVWHGPAKIEIKYNLPVPKLLSNIPNFPKPFTIRAYSECYNDSWYLGYPNNRSHS